MPNDTAIAEMIAELVAPAEGLRLSTGDALTVPDLLARMDTFRHNDDAYHNGETVLEHVGDVYMSVSDETEGWPTDRRGLLQLVALLHDLGKAYTYKLKGDRHTFYDHAKVSREIAAAVLDAGSLPDAMDAAILDLVYYHDVFFQLANQKKGTDLKYLKKFSELPVSRGDQLENLVAFARADSHLSKTYSETLANIDTVLRDLARYRMERADKEVVEAEKQQRMLHNLETYWDEILAVVEQAVPGAASEIPYLDARVVNRILGQAKQFKAIEAVKRILSR